MFPSERVDEYEGLMKLSGLDQETCAINLPLFGCIPHMNPPLGEGGWSFSVYDLRFPSLISVAPRADSCAGPIFCLRVSRNVRAPLGTVNSKSLVQWENRADDFSFGIPRDKMFQSRC